MKIKSDLKKGVCFHFLGLIIMTLLFVTVSCSDSGDSDDNVNLFLSENFLNIAHGGGLDLRPKNTLIAFQNSIDIGVDVLEMDVNGTSDGRVVVIHDDTVDSTTNGSGSVNDMTFEEIRMLDAGYNFTLDDGATYPYRGTGVVIPALVEIVALGKYMIIEIKQQEPSMVDAVMDIITAHGAEDKIILVSFHQDVLDEIRETYPSILTNFSTDETIEFYFLTAESETDYQPPAEFLHVPVSYNLGGTEIEVLTIDFISRAKRFNIKIHPWTINDRDEMVRLIGKGVDGIMTDRPDLLKEEIMKLDSEEG